MALKLNLSEIELITDPATVAGWMVSVLSEGKQIHTKGAAEMLIKRRLGIFKNLIDEINLKVIIVLVSITKIRADVLTWVKRFREEKET